jgi:putative hydrolase of HD superfamily
MYKTEENKRLDRQLQFILEIDKLKEVYRRSYLVNSQRRENSSEHSWHVAVIAMLMAEYGNEETDLCRVLCMLLVHDLVEIDAGDTYCYDEQGARDKAAREKEAAQRLFGFLPADQSQWIRSLWEEFEANTTPEARFANAVDRFMPLLHNFFTQGKSWLEHGITQDQVKARMAKVHDGSTILWEYSQKIIKAAVDRGYLRPNGDPG